MDKSNLMFDLINKIRKVWRMTVEIFAPSEYKQDSKSFSPETHEGLTSKGDVCPECDGAGIILDHDLDSGLEYECETCEGTGILEL